MRSRLAGGIAVRSLFVRDEKRGMIFSKSAVDIVENGAGDKEQVDEDIESDDPQGDGIFFIVDGEVVRVEFRMFGVIVGCDWQFGTAARAHRGLEQIIEHDEAVGKDT